MESYRRDLFIDMVIDRFTLKKLKKLNYALPPCLIFIPKTGEGLPKRG